MELVKNFVIDVNADDLSRNRFFSCIYCGDTTSLTRDHVIPVSWTGFNRSYSKGDVVKCCRECNSLLLNKPFHAISTRANFLAYELSRKYKRVLKHPIWEQFEIKQMDRNFQSTINSRARLKDYIISRIHHCTLVSLEDFDGHEVKQQKSTDGRDYRILQDLYHGYSLEEVSKNHKIELSILKKMFKTKNKQKIVNAFKYENGIPFDASVYAIFREIRAKMTK